MGLGRHLSRPASHWSLKWGIGTDRDGADSEQADCEPSDFDFSLKFNEFSESRSENRSRVVALFDNSGVYCRSCVVVMFGSKNHCRKNSLLNFGKVQRTIQGGAAERPLLPHERVVSLPTLAVEICPTEIAKCHLETNFAVFVI